MLATHLAEKQVKLHKNAVRLTVLYTDVINRCVQKLYKEIYLFKDFFASAQHAIISEVLAGEKA